MPDTDRGFEIHFAVSAKIGASAGKYSVSHMGFSIENTGYNCGRNEGRNSKSITSQGTFVMVRSTYRADGYYLTMTKNKVLMDLFKEFADDYLANKIDKNGNTIRSDENTSTSIPDNLNDKLWFIKTVRGLSDINQIKKAFVVDEDEYLDSFQTDHPLLNNVSYSNYVKFVTADNENEWEILLKSYDFLSNMSLDEYGKLRNMTETELESLLNTVTETKKDLTNRMYDTFLMISEDFNKGNYSMLTGANCVWATFFFMKQGLNYIGKKITSPADKAELNTMIKMFKKLSEGVNMLLMPWRPFRRARWDSNMFESIELRDVPEDNIYWKDTRRNAVMTDEAKTKKLRPRRRNLLINSLLEKTDVIDYEREGIEYTDSSKLPDSIPAEFKELLKAFNIGSGGGKRTRFEV